jgi:hypothetical protein
MSKLTVELPESLRKTIAATALAEGCSIDQFLALAAAEKIAALHTVEYLRREGARGRREDFERVLAAVPDVEPDEGDRVKP